MASYHAVRYVAPVPTAEGYRVGYVACADQLAADYSMAKHRDRGFAAEVIEVNRLKYNAILRGEWNTFKPTAGL
jgi:hypothetical protein